MQQDPYAGIARRDDERDPYEGIARRDGAEQSDASNAGAARRARVDQMAMQQFGKPYGELNQRERMEMGASATLMGQGASFGLMDEITSGADALAQGAGNLFRSATGQPIETTMGERYQRSHDIQNTELERRRTEAPIASAALEAVGGLGIAGPGRAAITQSPAALSAAGRFIQGAANVGKAALAGGAGGAAYGAGVAEQGERAAGAVQGGTFGALAGGALSAVAPAAGSLYRHFRSTGADNRAIGAARRAGLNPQNVTQAFDNAYPDDFIAEAVGGSAVRRARGLGGVTEEAAEVARGAIDERQARRFDRLVSEVRNVAGDDGTRAATRNVQQMREMAKPLFNQVDENVIQATPAIREQVRGLQRAGVSFRRADALAGASGSGRVRLSALADDADLPNDVRLGDIRALIAQAEDDAGRAFANGQGQMGRALADRSRTLRNALKDADPRFREASRLWHSAAQDERAIELGRDVFSGRAGAADELDEFVRSGMSDTERQGFLQGVSQAIEARAARAAEGGGQEAARFNPRFIRDRIRLVFGDDADNITGLLDQLNRQAEFESRSMRNIGSQTAGRIEDERAARGALRSGVANAIDDLGGTLTLKPVRTAASNAIRESGGGRATDAARLLFRPADPRDEELRKMLEAFERRNQLRGRQARGLIGGYAGVQAANASD